MKTTAISIDIANLVNLVELQLKTEKVQELVFKTVQDLSSGNQRIGDANAMIISHLNLSGGMLLSDETVGGLNKDEDFDVMHTPDIMPDFFGENPFAKQFAKASEKHENQAMDTYALSSQTVIDSTGAFGPKEDDLADINAIIGGELTQLRPVTISAMDVSTPTADNNVKSIVRYLQEQSVAANPQTSQDFFSSNSALLDISGSNFESSDTAISDMASFNGSIGPYQTLSFTSPFTTEASASTTLTESLLQPIRTTSYASSSPASTVIYDDESIFNVDNTYVPVTVTDHALYTVAEPTKRGRRTKKSKDMEPTPNDKAVYRVKNNEASRKSRTSKKEKLRQMEEKIKFFDQDNQRCNREIQELEDQINRCKEILFRAVKK